SIRPYSSSSAVCPSCGALLPTPLPACPKCFHIERPINKYDYYELLDTPKHPNPFVINENQLKNNFRRMQRYIHPDLWASQGQDKAHAARDLSGLVNVAYNTLLQPLSRIQYILSQRNVVVSETDQLDDVHLITEVLEMREALEDASSVSEVEEIKNDVTGKISVTLKKVEHAVQRESWDEAHREAVRLKFLRGIEAAAQSWPN
ncbi:Co-chaperone Hsc20, partial [Russula earlei]